MTDAFQIDPNQPNELVKFFRRIMGLPETYAGARRPSVRSGPPSQYETPPTPERSTFTPYSGGLGLMGANQPPSNIPLARMGGSEPEYEYGPRGNIVPQMRRPEPAPQTASGSIWSGGDMTPPMDMTPTPARPLPHPGQRMGANSLPHPGQTRSRTPAPRPSVPMPPTRQDENDGMHKVWYDKNMRRIGVGEAVPQGLDPDSFVLEPNKMTGFQRFMRQAWDVDEAGNPKSLFGKAEGGSVDHARRIASEKSTPCHTGIIHMAVGGRTDHLPMNVLEGSYVLPADIVSGLGEGNTLAGGKILDQMFSGKTGPAGARVPDFKSSPKYPEAQRPTPEDYSKYMKLGQQAGRSIFGSQEKDLSEPKAHGGTVISHNRKPVPIIAAGGEYVISPEDVERYGDGNLDIGHEKLDNFVKFVRANTVKTLRNLPGPRKD